MHLTYSQLLKACRENDIHSFQQLTSQQDIQLDFEEKSQLVFECVKLGHISILKIMHTDCQELKFPVFSSEFVHRAESPHHIAYIQYFQQERPQFFIHDAKNSPNFLLWALYHGDIPLAQYFTTHGYCLQSIDFLHIFQKKRSREKTLIILDYLFNNIPEPYDFLTNKLSALPSDLKEEAHQALLQQSLEYSLHKKESHFQHKV